MAILVLAAVVTGPLPAGAVTSSVAITSRVSLSSTNAQNLQHTGYSAQLDATGRWVFFTSKSALEPGDTNGVSDVYRRDRLTGATERVSLWKTGEQLVFPTELCGVSGNGRYVAFQFRGNQVSPDYANQIWRHDLVDGSNDTASSTGSEDAQGGADPTDRCPMSYDGSRLVYTSAAKNLSGDPDSVADAFVHRFDTDTNEKVSVSTGGTSGNKMTSFATISADGNVVAFSSDATNLVAGDTNGESDVFVRTLSTNTTARVSTDAVGGQLEGDSQSAAISSNGRYVAFSSTAIDAVPDDENGTRDIFRKDRQTGAVVRVSVSSGGQEGNGYSTLPQISADGRYVAFMSSASNLYPADVNGARDTFRHDVDLAKTDLASRKWNGINTGNGDSWGWPDISADGRIVAFTSAANDLVAGDTNGAIDAFVRDFGLDLAPFGSAKAFATQQLKDFGHPLPRPSDVGAATDALLQGLTSPDHSIVVRSRDAGWAGKRPPLIRLYWAFFLRAPDQGGLTYWTGKLTKGTKLAQVAAQFAKSSEFQSTYGSKTNSQFVTLIYQNIFERSPDAGGLAYWTAKLDAKAKSRGDVMTNFSESSEGKRLLAPQVDTIDIWLGMLGTMPPNDAFNLYVGQQKDGQPPEIVPAHLRTLGSYAARITP